MLMITIGLLLIFLVLWKYIALFSNISILIYLGSICEFLHAEPWLYSKNKTHLTQVWKIFSVCSCLDFVDKFCTNIHTIISLSFLLLSLIWILGKFWSHIFILEELISFHCFGRISQEFYIFFGRILQWIHLC